MLQIYVNIHYLQKYQDHHDANPWECTCHRRVFCMPMLQHDLQLNDGELQHDLQLNDGDCNLTCSKDQVNDGNCTSSLISKKYVWHVHCIWYVCVYLYIYRVGPPDALAASGFVLSLSCIDLARLI